MSDDCVVAVYVEQILCACYIVVRALVAFVPPTGVDVGVVK